MDATGDLQFLQGIPVRAGTTLANLTNSAPLPNSTSSAMVKSISGMLTGEACLISRCWPADLGRLHSPYGRFGNWERFLLVVLRPYVRFGFRFQQYYSRHHHLLRFVQLHPLRHHSCRHFCGFLAGTFGLCFSTRRLAQLLRHLR